MVKESIEWEHNSSRYYLKGQEDQLVDGYEAADLPALPKDIDILNETAFESGLAIGSSFFKFQLNETLKRER